MGDYEVGTKLNKQYQEMAQTFWHTLLFLTTKELLQAYYNILTN